MCLLFVADFDEENLSDMQSTNGSTYPTSLVCIRVKHREIQSMELGMKCEICLHII